MASIIIHSLKDLACIVFERIRAQVKMICPNPKIFSLTSESYSQAVVCCDIDDVFSSDPKFGLGRIKGYRKHMMCSFVLLL